LGVRREVISYWETGARCPGLRQLRALAHLYGIAASSLLDDEDPSLTAPDLNAQVGALPASARPGVLRFLSFLDSYADLRDALGIPRQTHVRLYSQGAPPSPRECAEQARARFSVGALGACDPMELLRRSGCVTFTVGLGSGPGDALDGACYDHPTAGCGVLVNADLPPGRQNFTAAHELGHVLCHQATAFWCRTSSREKPPEERFCERFAADLLVPLDALKEAVKSCAPRRNELTPAMAAALARRFGVSYSVMRYRLEHAKLVGPEAALLLQQCKATSAPPSSRCDWHAGSPVLAIPQDVLALAQRAFRDGVIGASKLAEILGASIDEALEFAVDYPMIAPAEAQW
jgi:Zn-dependent peptidase ImmA (M78 family)